MRYGVAGFGDERGAFGGEQHALTSTNGARDFAAKAAINLLGRRAIVGKADQVGRFHAQVARLAVQLDLVAVIRLA